MITRTRLLCILALLIILAGCVSTPPEYGFRLDQDPDVHIRMGANAAPFLPGDEIPDFSPVASLYDVESAYVSSSSVLIAPNWVLTAGHCIISEEDDGSIFEFTPQTLTVRFGPDGSAPLEEVAVRSIHVHPEYRADLEKGDQRGFDIALVELASPVTTVEPAVLYSSRDEPVGSRVVGAGFGDYMEQLGDGVTDWSTRRAWENTLDRVVELPQKAGIVSYDFDSPDGWSETYGSANTLGSEFATWEVDEETRELLEVLGAGDSADNALPLEGTSVPGDSGGPLFVWVDDQWQVIGVVSFGSTIGYYGDIAFYTRVSTHYEWITGVISGN